MSSSSLELEPEEDVYVRDLLEQHLELTQVWLILSSVWFAAAAKLHRSVTVGELKFFVIYQLELTQVC